MIDAQAEKRRTVAKLVTEARERRGLTQQQLAAGADLSLRQVVNIENAHVAEPRLQTWRRLRAVLDLPLLDELP